MKKRRTETWLLLAVLAIGAIPVGIAGLWAYVSATTTPLHPDPTGAPSVVRAAAPPAWAGAVSQGRRAVRAALAGQNLPGLSVAVGIEGDLVWAEGFGWADLERRVPVTPETRFRIGTASIALTSAGAGVLLEDGRLQLDGTIQTYVPDVPQKPWPVTMHQLMGHVAGIRNDGGDEGPLFSKHCDRPGDALEVFSDRSLLFEPGTRFRPSSYGWILVSAAIEAAAARPFLAFMRDEVFEPLGMRDTEADSGERLPNLATFYFPRFAADPRYGLHLMRPIDLSCYAGSSVFVSTPTDLVQFGLAMHGGSLLQPATVERLQTSLQLSSGEETGYGLGWALGTADVDGRQTRWVGHEGMVLGGPVASLIAFPEQGIVVAVASNISYAETHDLALTIARGFTGAALGRPSEPAAAAPR